MFEKKPSFDFHLHTCWSYDATTPVEYYFAKAEEFGVTHIAITDHHHNDGFEEALAAAQRHPSVKYISGAEFTVHCPLGTFDMVCLGLPGKPTPGLQEVIDAYHKWQCDYGDALCDGFTAAGYPFTREERLELLRRYRPEKTIAVQGVTHVQYWLLGEYLINEKKYFKSREELGEVLWNLPHDFYPEADFVIPKVKAAGGTVFIAHPTGYFNKNDLKRMDALREMLNFDGIECAHPSVPPELTSFYREYCLKNQLLSSGGSDTHVPPDCEFSFASRCDFGKHIGEDIFLKEILERVKCVEF